MALADTARLIASLELQDKFSKNAAAFDRTVQGMTARTSTLDRIGGQISRGAGAAVNNIKLIGAAGLGVLALSVRSGLETLQKLENVTTQTNAVLESTQGVAGQTAESIRNLAEKYEGLNATIDDKVIQSGENLLLTFTNINEDAFEPALEAALNLNTALGGGEEGLQGTIIQVGKALQDPIRGLTNLRRVGVNFSEQQKKQIKDLVAQNRLYDAQQIILQELATEFGGSFAAAGDTAAGKFAKLRDAVEDSQSALTTALLPVLEKVSDRLSTFLTDPKTVAAIEDFGQGLADGFDQAVEFAGKVPWELIGSSLQIAGTGAKAVFDAFTGLPDWVQTAVITGWGLNKLTGGALTGIAGTLFGRFFERGASPANPLWVASVGGGVGGPGGVGTKFPLLPLAPAVVAATVPFISGSNVNTETAVKMIDFAASKAGATLDDVLNTNPTLGALVAFVADPTLTADVDPKLLAQIKELTGQTELIPDRIDKEREAIIQHLMDQGLSQDEAVAQMRLTAANTADAARLTGLANSQLVTLNSKDLSPNVKIDVTAVTNVSVNPLIRTLTSARIAGSGTIGGFTESAF